MPGEGLQLNHPTSVFASIFVEIHVHLERVFLLPLLPILQFFQSLISTSFAECRNEKSTCFHLGASPNPEKEETACIP